MGISPELALLFAIIAVNLIVSLLGFRAFRESAARGDSPYVGGGSALSDPDTFLFIPYAVARGQKFPGVLISNMSHAGWLHFGFNMFALFSFAGGVLRELGALDFMIIYAVAGAGCNLVVYVLRKDDPTYRSLGASGSVFGIVTAAVLIDPTISVVFLFIPIPIPGPVFMAVYILISLYLISRNTRDGISHEGHLGGALAGFLITGVLAPAGYGPLIDWISRAVGS